ncbi:cobyrinate a,c-diamide synthase [Desulfopila sp. IMCC35008]|uniref:cobyrinate a,c-diamide synthase n=1 Tax=Desulfopila sp. IMCC35008 TaxID=2653858 RepID=UPI001F115BCE|nr:cobyrinate a,c-diamide synthase [Desulfopila sp. IMCC35008]
MMSQIDKQIMGSKVALNGARGLVVAGLAGGSGKSVVSVGLTAVFASAGKEVVPFKKGPDYIDAGWLQLAAGRKCYNLDPYLVDEEILQNSFIRNSAEAEIALLEGNRGLYDGVTADGGYSTADLAILLDLPVLLVVNCTKTTRTVAAMVLGCMKLDERIKIKGVVLNHVATNRQRRLVSEAVEKYTGVPVLGVIPRMERDIFPMRHLGMIPYQEYNNSGGALDFLKETVSENVDIDRIESIMKPIGTTFNSSLSVRSEFTGEKVKIGIMQDAAFQFYYSENLEALEREGAEIIPLNALADKELPPLDGLYIGGGFPETSARELAANESFRASVKQAAEDGLPIYAECGGLIYLGESLEQEGVVYPLAGVFPARFGMSPKPQAHGYSVFTVEEENPFYPVGTEVKGHEFRYSTVLKWSWSTDTRLTLRVERGKGFFDKRDGLCRKNVLALYTHVHADGTPTWAKGLVDKCRACRLGSANRGS